MNEKEVIRRLRALIRTTPNERPITVDRLESIAGISEGELYTIARRGSMRDSTRARLARALTWVENNQVVVRKHPNRPTEVAIVDPKPPQTIATRVEFTEGGPKVRFVALNPLTFPYFRDDS